MELEFVFLNIHCVYHVLPDETPQQAFERSIFPIARLGSVFPGSSNCVWPHCGECGLEGQFCDSYCSSQHPKCKKCCDEMVCKRIAWPGHEGKCVKEET